MCILKDDVKSVLHTFPAHTVTAFQPPGWYVEILIQLSKAFYRVYSFNLVKIPTVGPPQLFLLSSLIAIKKNIYGQTTWPFAFDTEIPQKIYNSIQ